MTSNTLFSNRRWMVAAAAILILFIGGCGEDDNPVASDEGQWVPVNNLRITPGGSYSFQMESGSNTSETFKWGYQFYTGYENTKARLTYKAATSSRLHPMRVRVASDIALTHVMLDTIYSNESDEWKHHEIILMKSYDWHNDEDEDVYELHFLLSISSATERWRMSEPLIEVWIP